MNTRFPTKHCAIIIRRGAEKWASKGKLLCRAPHPFSKAELVQSPSWSLDNFYYPPSPHTKYNVTVEVENLENRLRFLFSDNPACAGRFLREGCKPKPSDDNNIRPCKRQANRILDKLHAITENITKNDDSLFTEGGKLNTEWPKLPSQFQQWETTLYQDWLIEKDVLHLVEDLDRVMAKYKATYQIGTKFTTSEARKRKEQKKKGGKRKLAAWENRRKRACLIFRPLFLGLWAEHIWYSPTGNSWLVNPT